MSSGSKYTETEKKLLTRYSKEYYRAINRCLKSVSGKINKRKNWRRITIW